MSAIILQGETGDVLMDSCYVTQFFHVIWTMAIEERKGRVQVLNCLMFGVQYGVKLLIRHESGNEENQHILQVLGCHIKLEKEPLADEGEESLPLIGVSATGGNVKLCQTFIEMTGNDGWETAASIHSCVDVHVNTNRFETPQDTNRSVRLYYYSLVCIKLDRRSYELKVYNTTSLKFKMNVVF